MPGATPHPGMKPSLRTETSAPCRCGAASRGPSLHCPCCCRSASKGRRAPHPCPPAAPAPVPHPSRCSWRGRRSCQVSTNVGRHWASPSGDPVETQAHPGIGGVADVGATRFPARAVLHGKDHTIGDGFQSIALGTSCGGAWALPRGTAADHLPRTGGAAVPAPGLPRGSRWPAVRRSSGGGSLRPAPSPGGAGPQPATWPP